MKQKKMTKVKRDDLIKLLNKMKKDYSESDAGKRSTIGECVDYLVVVLGGLV